VAQDSAGRHLPGVSALAGAKGGAEC